MEARKRYFQTGELPKNGTLCQPEVVPFGDDLEDLKDESEMDRAMLGLADLATRF